MTVTCEDGEDGEESVNSAGGGENGEECSGDGVKMEVVEDEDVKSVSQTEDGTTIIPCDW